MTDKKLHILLVNNYTCRCGITKAVASLANAMAERGHRITIISQRPVPRPLKPLYDIFVKIRELSLPEGQLAPLPLGTEKLEDMYELHPDIKTILYSFTDKNLKIQKLRKKIKELNPDVCVCMLPDGSQLVWAVTLLGTGVPYIYSEHTSPEAIEERFWTRKGRLAAMSGADAIHLLLPSYMESLPDFVIDRATVIGNVVEIPADSSAAWDNSRERKALLWLGRLQEEIKQCRLAIDAFALLAKKFPDWDLHIAGDGQDSQLIKDHARKLIETENLEGRIKFLGEQKDVWPIFASAQAFCITSRMEGMPMALLEAMACGLPCVGFKKCQGTSDIISHDKNGLLAEDMSAFSLASELEKLFTEAELRKRLGNAARRSMETYSSNYIYNKWETLLRETANKKGSTIMDDFANEPFASMARLSSRARSEWAMRDFGEPFPDTIAGKIFKYKRKIRKYLMQHLSKINLC